MTAANGEERRRDRAYLEEIAETAAERACAKTFTLMGFDVDNPIAVQRDVAHMQAARAREADPEIGADRAWVRRNRVRCEKVKDQASGTVVKAIVAALLALLVAGLLVYGGRARAGNVSPPPAPQANNPLCYERLELLERLRDRHGEVVVWRGLSAGWKMVELLQSPDGAWTAIITPPFGEACIVATGSRGRDPRLDSAPLRRWPAAHGADWISRGGYRTPAGQSCCGEVDCVPLAPGSVPLVGDDFWIEYDGRVFLWPWAHAIPTADEKQQPFVCFDYDRERRPTAVRCFFRDEWKG